MPEVSQLRRQADAVARIAERIEAIQHDDWRSSTPWAQTEGVPPSAGICGLASRSSPGGGDARRRGVRRLPRRLGGIQVWPDLMRLSRRVVSSGALEETNPRGAML